jgi:hypothetical protein
LSSKAYPALIPKEIFPDQPKKTIPVSKLGILTIKPFYPLLPAFSSKGGRRLVMQCVVLANNKFVPRSLQFSNPVIPGTRTNILPLVGPDM